MEIMGIVRRFYYLFLGGALLLVIATIYLVLIQSGSSHASSDRAINPALTVEVVKAEQRLFDSTEVAYGFLSPWQEISIGMELQGLRVKEVFVDVGDTVKQGQVLATFDSTLVRSDYADSEARVAEAAAQLREAEIQLQAAKASGEGAISKVQIAQYEAAVESARSRYQSAKAQLAKQQYWLQQTQITAPYAGVISSRSISAGQDLNSGTELFRLIRQGRLEWQAELSAMSLTKIRVGKSVEIVLESGQVLKGLVRQVSPSVDRTSRIGIVYVDVPYVAESGLPIAAGMFAKGTFRIDQKKVQAIPQSAISWRDGFSWVMYVDSKTRTVQQQQVKLGALQKNWYEVLTPIPPDWHIIREGSGFLNPGDTVRIVDTPKSGALPNDSAMRPAAKATDSSEKVQGE